jgi:heme/copper-type cytochrome/quinol oxidase subunit 3
MNLSILLRNKNRRRLIFFICFLYSDALIFSSFFVCYLFDENKKKEFILIFLSFYDYPKKIDLFLYLKKTNLRVFSMLYIYLITRFSSTKSRSKTDKIPCGSTKKWTDRSIDQITKESLL